MHPHVPGNLTPLKFHCALMRSVTQGSISLAVTIRKLNSPEYCKAPKRDMHQFSFYLKPNSTNSVEFPNFPEIFNSWKIQENPNASD